MAIGMETTRQHNLHRDGWCGAYSGGWLNLARLPKIICFVVWRSCPCSVCVWEKTSS